MIDHPTTKALLMDSMMELMNSRPIENISVREIAENCNVSTRSFYNYFKDKHDIINAIYMEKEHELFCVEFPPGVITRLSLVNLFSYVKKYRRFYDNACSYTGQNNLLESICDQGYLRMMDCIRAKDNITDVPADLCFAARMWLNGMKDTIKEWLSDGCLTDPEELTDLILFASPECMLRYIE